MSALQPLNISANRLPQSSLGSRLLLCYLSNDVSFNTFKHFQRFLLYFKHVLLVSGPFQESGFFFGAAADLPTSTCSLAVSAANRHGDHGIAHAPSRITRGHVHSVRVMRARARWRGRSARYGRRAPTRASRSPANEMGSLTCFSMRFDDKTSVPRLTPRFAWRRSTNNQRLGALQVFQNHVRRRTLRVNLSVAPRGRSTRVSTKVTEKQATP